MFDEKRAPAVTVKRVQGGAGGWKLTDQTEYLTQRCNTSQSYGNILQCVESNTFSLEETIGGVLVGPKEKLKNLTVNSKAEYSDTWTGKTYRLREGLVWDTYDLNMISFVPDDTAEYWVDIHDPDFYFSSYHSGALPKGFKQLKAGTAYTLDVEVVYHERRDREEESCEAGEGYSFTACVKVGVE